MSKLFIDTSSNKEIKVSLIVNKEEKVLERKIGEQKAQVVLSMIDEILRKSSLKLKNIDGIEVNTGPGSFTGLRVGVAVANALGFALDIPVNGKNIEEFVEPAYE